MRGVTVSIQLRPDIRPKLVKLALTRAAQGHVSILSEPAVRIAIKSSTINFVEYEIRFFMNRQEDEASVTTRYFDIAFQHLDSLSVPREPIGEAQTERDNFGVNDRLTERTGLFDALPPHEHDALLGSLQSRSANTDDSLYDGDRRLDGILVVCSGVLSVSMHDSKGGHEVARLNPGDYWFDLAKISDRSTFPRIHAMTRSQVLLIPREQSIVLTGSLQLSSELPSENCGDVYGNGRDNTTGHEHTKSATRRVLQRFFHVLINHR